MKTLLAVIAVLWAGLAQATVTTTTTANTYACNGVTTVFTITFPFVIASDLVVTNTAGGGSATSLVLGTDYTVAGAALTTIGALSPCASGRTLKISRNTGKTQPTSFRTQGTFNPRAHEAAFDRLTMIAQELAATPASGGAGTGNGGGNGSAGTTSACTGPARCDGSTDDTSALDALLATIGSTPTTLVVSGPMKITANRAIPATAPVRFEANGAFVGTGVVSFKPYFTADRMGIWVATTAPALSVTYDQWAATGRGYWSWIDSSTLSADVTAPSVTTFTLGSSMGLAVPVTGLTGTDDVGVTGWAITAASSAPALGAFSAAPGYWFAPSSGSYTLYAWARDAAGNISASKSAGPVSPAELPFSDSFTTNYVGGLYDQLGSAASWAVSSGILTVPSGALNSNPRLAPKTSVVTNHADITVSVDFRYDSWARGFPGVMARYTDENNWVIAQLQLDGGLHIYQYKAGVFTDLGDTTRNPATGGQNVFTSLVVSSWYTLKLTLSSGTWTISLKPQGGGAEKLTGTITGGNVTLLTSGRAGITTNMSPGGTGDTIAFDNLVLQ